MYTQEKNEIEIILLLTIFSLSKWSDIIRNDEDPKVEIMNECQHIKDWLKCKEYIKKKRLIIKMRSIWTYSPNT